MKKTLLYFASLVMSLWVMTACSADEYLGADPSKRPQASDINATITVDQELNQVTFNLDNKGCVPIWRVYKNGIDKDPIISTRDGYTDIFPIAGTYTVEIQMYNHHGICEGMKTEQFTINNTIVDWARYMTPLTGGNAKVWEMAAGEKGHLACGEPGSDGTNWWSAGANEKAGWGLYENKLTFADNGGNGTGAYTFDPGTSGTIYVNTGVTEAPLGAYRTDDGNDYNYPIAAPVQTQFQFVMEGNDVYLVFPAETPLIYVPNIDAWRNPKFKVHALTGSKIELTWSNSDIVWHYQLQPEGAGQTEPDPSGIDWVDINSADNLMNSGKLELASFWWADDNWSPVADPTIEFTGNNAKITATAANGSSQWQGQVHLKTGVAIAEGVTYDFKIVLAPTQSMAGVTVKPHPDGEDGKFFSEGRHNLNAYEDNEIIYDTYTSEFTTDNLIITLDFPSSNVGTVIDVKGIIIQEHRGAIVPPAGTDWVDVNSDDNLLNSGGLALKSFWWANDGWSQITDPAIEFKGNNAKVTVKETSGGSQWQGQLHLDTLVPIEEGTAYDFRVNLVPSKNLTGVTVKPHPDGEDGKFFSEARHDLNAYDDNYIEYSNCVADFSTGNLVITLDFPGCEAGTEIEIKDIIIQKHREGAAGGSSMSWVDVTSADNLFNSGSFKLASCWWANDSWTQITDPTVSTTGLTALIKVNEGNGGSQWQGQVHFNTGTSMVEGIAYDFKVVLYSTQALAGVTVKPHPEGDDGKFISEARHDLAAYDDTTVTYTGYTSEFSTSNLVLTFDFPSAPAGTEIEIKQIILQEHK